jgi:DNA gyrase subunit A
MIINKSGITIRVAVSECRIMSRVTQGVRLINLEKKGDVIASVCKVMGSELEAAVEEESRRQWTKNQDDLANDNKADGENAAPASESEVESPVEGEQPENTEE